MKLKQINKMLLTKADMNNKVNFDNLKNTIEEKVKDYKDNLENEFIRAYGEDNIKTLCDSEDKYNELIRIYNNCEECIPKIITGFMFSLAGIFVLFESPMIGEWQIMLSTIIAIVGGLCFLVTGIKQHIIRRKIKKNFKKLGMRI